MDNQKKPRAREKKVVETGKGVEIHGEGLETGPVNNMGNYEDRKPHPSSVPQSGRPSGSGFGSPFGQSSSHPPRPQSGQRFSASSFILLMYPGSDPQQAPA